MTRKRILVFFIVVFCGFGVLCSGLSFYNVYLQKGTIGELFQQYGYSKEFFAELDSLYRMNVVKREKWIDLYGFAQNAFQRRIIGNMEYIKADDDLMDVMRVYPIQSGERLAKDIVELNESSKLKDTNFLYIQMPVRNDGSVPLKWIQMQSYFDQIREITDPAGVVCMDGNDILSNMSLEEFYFKTDIHPSTQGELEVSRKIVEILEKSWGITIDNTITNLYDDNYELHSHKMLGNLGKSVGKYYNGLDVFYECVPKNNDKTNFRITDLETDVVIKSGRYSDVVMNGYDDILKPDTYWITNYMQYGRYAYNVENLSIEGPKLLIFCDSYCYRTISFLSMGCREITVVDPRFNKDNHRVEELIELSEYDAVIFLHGATVEELLGGNACNEGEK